MPLENTDHVMIQRGASPHKTTLQLLGAFFGLGTIMTLAGRALNAHPLGSGRQSPLRSHPTYAKTATWNPPGNGTNVPGVDGVNAPAVVGTATARNVATTNRFTRMKRLGYVSASTAAALAGHYQSVAQHTISATGAADGGFHLVIRFGCSDAAAVAGARQFVGMTNSVAAPTNVEPSTLTNVIGIGHGAADTNLKLYWGGSAAQAPIDLGASFPVNTLSVDPYQFELYAAPGSPTPGYRVENLRTGAVATGSFTNATPGTTLPALTTLLALRAWRCNNATALAVGLDIMGWSIESDY